VANTGVRMPFEPNIHGARQYWQELSRPVQVGVIAAGVAFLLFLVMIFSHLTSPGKEVLFQDMQPGQAREVVQKLEEEGVSYELRAEGTEIRVPPGERDRLRLELAPDMHAQGVGFEIYEDTGLLTSDYERRKTHQAALQEELRRTISSIEDVNNARVHLALPNPRDLAWDTADPSATVLVDTAPMVNLEESQLQGIVYLVTGSVENLKPENVSVTDSRGHLLYDTLKKSAAGASDVGQVEEQMELERQFERNLESRLQQVLQRIYGPEGAEVMITARLDFDERDLQEIEYDDEGVPRSEQISEERHESEGADLPEGEVGEENIPGYQTPYLEGDQEYEYTEEITNYEISEVREIVSAAPGDIEQLSAMVAINEEGPAQEVAEEEINDLISSALGHDPETGTISVSRMPFEEIPEAEWWEHEGFVEQMVQYIVYAIVALLAFILLLVLVLRKTGAEEEWEGAVAGMPQGFALEDVMGSEEQGEDEERKEKVKEMIEENPEHAALLLRTWLSEE